MAKMNQGSAKSLSSNSQVSESKLDADDDISESNTLEALEQLKKDEFEWSIYKPSKHLIIFCLSFSTHIRIFIVNKTIHLINIS